MHHTNGAQTAFFTPPAAWFEESHPSESELLLVPCCLAHSE
jgi:hypothetical protein